jgi:hypothetical protein
MTDGVLTVAMHPQVIGRGSRIDMLATFIEHCRSAGGVQFERIGDVVDRLNGYA